MGEHKVLSPHLILHFPDLSISPQISFLFYSYDYIVYMYHILGKKKQKQKIPVSPGAKFQAAESLELRVGSVEVKPMLLITSLSPQPLCHIFFIHSSVDRCLGWFQFLLIVNAAVKRCAKTTIVDWKSLGIYMPYTWVM